MGLLLLTEVCQFHEGGERSPLSTRRRLMLASLSPATRKLALTGEGLTIGSVSFRNGGTEMNITIANDGPPPPVGWWRYSGTVTVAGHNAPLGACGVISTVKNAWSVCRVTRVELTSDDGVDAVVQRQILYILGLLQNEVISLCLGKLRMKNADLAPCLPSLNSLSLYGCDGRIEKWLSALSTAAEIVEISDCFSLSDATFKSMPTTSVDRLVLDNTNVAASFLEHLKCRHSVRTLSLMDCRKIDTSQVGAFPQLRRLLLCRTPVASESLEGVEKCHHLQIVNLGGCQEVVDVNVLGALKQLRELFLHETSVTNAGIAALANCKRLEKLNLGGCVHVSNVNHLGRLANLLELHLWSTKVTNSGIEGLASCCSLVELVLDDCVRITDVLPLGCLQSIRWLSLIGTEVEAPGVKGLIHCEKLETLALGGTRIAHPPKLWRHEAIVEYLGNLT
ncbi:hypothetical protein, unknown function [Leishmania donovani]|uniref:F-box/LRR-repeat protein 15-like leucin rich repeat domain-containing protein n=2 Tax=Leishmania donovani TaxID=5661 RepID=E9BQF6_LEIDO|nr:hypothetical protein, unknown function [Leishmania donovani]CBZ37485.1 hypothetical protein, unknown function [Leishmania donovani]